ncbi:hypothetical protein [Haliangium sp.]|uniref:hypothetical protein n=2 Tax=Haliangium sp. TaxID=2663208 RepID=UPI003D0A3123
MPRIAAELGRRGGMHDTARGLLYLRGMNKLTILAVLALSIFSQGCIIVSDDGDSTLTIYNDSSYVLDEIYVSPVGAATWGRDLTGGDILYPDESLTVSLDCDYYDVMVVDETGVECILSNLDLCFDDATWYVDDVDLDFCAFGVLGVEALGKSEAQPPKPAEESSSPAPETL